MKPLFTNLSLDAGSRREQAPQSYMNAVDVDQDSDGGGTG